VFHSAAVLTLVQFCHIAADSAVLAETTGLHIREVAGANFFAAGIVGSSAALSIAAVTAGKRRPTLLCWRRRPWF